MTNHPSEWAKAYKLLDDLDKAYPFADKQRLLIFQDLIKQRDETLDEVVQLVEDNFYSKYTPIPEGQVQWRYNSDLAKEIRQLKSKQEKSNGNEK